MNKKAKKKSNKPRKVSVAEMERRHNAQLMEDDAKRVIASREKEAALFPGRKEQVIEAERALKIKQEFEAQNVLRAERALKEKKAVEAENVKKAQASEKNSKINQEANRLLLKKTQANTVKDAHSEAKAQIQKDYASKQSLLRARADAKVGNAHSAQEAIFHSSIVSFIENNPSAEGNMDNNLLSHRIYNKLETDKLSSLESDESQEPFSSSTSTTSTSSSTSTSTSTSTSSSSSQSSSSMNYFQGNTMMEQAGIPSTMMKGGGLTTSNAYHPDQQDMDYIDAQPKTYNDDSIKENAVSQQALDTEQYKGVSQQSLRGMSGVDINNMDNEEQNESIERATDIISQKNMLAGGSNGTLFNGNELGEDTRYDTGLNDARSGIQRGRESHQQTEVDLQDLNQSSINLSQGHPMTASGGDGDTGISTTNRRTGLAVNDAYLPNRTFDDPIGLSNSKQGLTQASSILESSNSLINLTNDENTVDLSGGNRPIIPSSSGSGDIGIEGFGDRINQANRSRLTKNFRPDKFKHNFNDDYKALYASGGHRNRPLSDQIGQPSDRLDQSRAGNKIPYRQPDRAYKGNAINLIRISNATATRLDNEYQP